jgi:uncharacterized membrane protein
MNFLPIALLAYLLNAISTIIDKVLLKTSLPNPIAYTFYINLLGGVTLLLIPFGVKISESILFFSCLSGLFGVLALLFYFQALKSGQASVVSPVTGGLNPMFTFIIGLIFLNYSLTQTQTAGLFTTFFGTAILTFSLWAGKLKFNSQLINIFLAGLFFALGYLTLKEVFIRSNLVTGLVLSRAFGTFLALLLLLVPKWREEIFSSKLVHNNFLNKTSLLFLIGQILGASTGFLLSLATYFSNPALVNSLFGVQYIVLLAAALVLAHKHKEKLLDEVISKKTLFQKVIGAIILSIGVYLLSL